VKRTGKGDSIEIVIHTCTGTIQGSTLCSYLYLKLAKHKVSPFIFYVWSTKSQNKRAEQVLSGRRGIGKHGRVR
jgi:hypothetical protein